MHEYFRTITCISHVMKSLKSNATPQIHSFIIDCWLVSPITMEIDARLATHFI